MWQLNESYWAVLSCGLFIMLWKVVLTFESVDEILKCDHSNESYWAILSRGLFIMLCMVVLTFKSVRDEILKSDHSNESERKVDLFIWLCEVIGDLQKK